MKKISTLKLIGLLALLLLIYAATEFFSNTGRSQSFRKELVSIDVVSVSRVELTKGANNIVIDKKDEGWKVSTNSAAEYQAEEDKIKNALSSLQTIKPSRVASRNPEKWQEFQVDTSGTRVQVFEGKDKTLDLVIGRFGMQGQQKFHSYIRLYDDDNVYVAENFMGFSIPTDEASYRNQTVTSFNKDSVSTIRFIYPADSSFSIQKSINGNWISGELTPDSSKTAQFINALSRLNSSKFENESSISGLAPTYQVVIEIPEKDLYEIKAIAKTDSTFIIASSQNQEGQFEDPSLFDKIFKSKSSFLPEEPDEGT
jgi:hypothetical protein